MNILIIENSMTQQIQFTKTIHSKLEKAMVHATDLGGSAMDLCMVNKYDLIVCDYLLDSETGIDVVKKIRETSLNKNTKIILWSASNDYIDMLNGEEGVTAMRKPKKISEIVSIVTGAIVGIKK